METSEFLSKLEVPMKLLLLSVILLSFSCWSFADERSPRNEKEFSQPVEELEADVNPPTAEELTAFLETSRRTENNRSPAVNEEERTERSKDPYVRLKPAAPEKKSDGAKAE